MPARRRVRRWCARRRRRRAPGRAERRHPADVRRPPAHDRGAPPRLRAATSTGGGSIVSVVDAAARRGHVRRARRAARRHRRRHRASAPACSAPRPRVTAERRLVVRSVPDGRRRAARSLPRRGRRRRHALAGEAARSTPGGCGSTAWRGRAGIALRAGQRDQVDVLDVPLPIDDRAGGPPARRAVRGRASARHRQAARHGRASGARRAARHARARARARPGCARGRRSGRTGRASCIASTGTRRAILLVARTTAALEALARQFRERTSRSATWRSSAGGSRGAGTVDRPIGRASARAQADERARARRGRAAVTRWAVVERFAGATLRPRGARDRADAPDCACTWPAWAIRSLGDQVYGGRRRGPRAAARSWLPVPRQALHAPSSRFTHPVTGVPLVLAAALPTDLQEVLARATQGAANSTEIARMSA